MKNYISIMLLSLFMTTGVHGSQCLRSIQEVTSEDDIYSQLFSVISGDVELCVLMDRQAKVILKKYIVPEGFVEILQAHIHKSVDKKKIRSNAIKSLKKIFSPEEAEEAVRFFNTRLGRKTLNLGEIIRSRMFNELSLSIVLTEDLMNDLKENYNKSQQKAVQ